MAFQVGSVGILVILIVLTIIIAYSSCALVTKPNNIACVVGEKVTFTGISDLVSYFISWSYIKTGDTYIDEYYIFTNRLLRGRQLRFSVSLSESGNHTFVIKNVSQRDAGVHILRDRNGSGTGYEFELIVLESSPSCGRYNFQSEISTKEMVEISCSLNVTGNLTPRIISWDAADEKTIFAMKTVPRNSERCIAIDFLLITNYVANATYCVLIYFDATVTDNAHVEVVAKINPSYEFYWTSSVLNFSQVCKIPVSLRGNDKLITPSANITFIHQRNLDNSQKQHSEFESKPPSTDKSDVYIFKSNTIVTNFNIETGYKIRLEEFELSFWVPMIVLSVLLSVAVFLLICVCVRRKFGHPSAIESAEKFLNAHTTLPEDGDSTDHKDQGSEYEEIDETTMRINERLETIVFGYEALPIREEPRVVPEYRVLDLEIVL